MSLPRGYNEAGAEWLEPWCDEHPDLDGEGCVACIGASHDAWMHRAKAAEREVERLREALTRASRALDEVVVYFDGSTRIPPGGFPLASVVRPAQRLTREALEAGER
jgi:hypothetical protein